MKMIDRFIDKDKKIKKYEKILKHLFALLKILCYNRFDEVNIMVNEKKLDDVLQFIIEYTNEYGYAPSVRDVCAELHIKSTATAYSYIAKLQERGDLNKASNKKRAVSVQAFTPQIKAPLIGKVTAGYPIFAVQNYQGYYNLPANEFGGDIFMLEVSGDSMINAGINSGDKIIVRKQPTAENGEIVVALVDDREDATIKRFYKKDDKIILHPENDDYPDFVYEKDESVEILGKVVGLLRNFK